MLLEGSDSGVGSSLGGTESTSFLPVPSLYTDHVVERIVEVLRWRRWSTTERDQSLDWAGFRAWNEAEEGGINPRADGPMEFWSWCEEWRYAWKRTKECPWGGLLAAGRGESRLIDNDRGREWILSVSSQGPILYGRVSIEDWAFVTDDDPNEMNWELPVW